MAKTKKKSTLGRMTESVKKSVIKPVGRALGLTGGKKKASGAKKGGATKRGTKKAGGRKK